MSGDYITETSSSWTVANNNYVTVKRVNIQLNLQLAPSFLSTRKIQKLGVCQ